MNQPNNDQLDDHICIGIDWADVLHAFHLVDRDEQHHAGSFTQEPRQIEAIVTHWRSRFPDASFAVAIEQSRGPLISALLNYEDVTIYPVNPAALAAYRKAFAHGGGKNDPGDARLLVQYLQHYGNQLRPLKRDQPLTRELATLAEDRRRLVDQRSALANELRAVLKHYFPAVLELKPAQMHAEFVLRLLRAYPTLAQAQQAGEAALRECLRGGTARKVQQRVDIILNAIPLSEEAVLVRTSARRVTALCRLIGALNESIDGYEDDMKALVREHDDYELVASLPGASDNTHCRLIAALGDDRSRYENASALQSAAGIAPVTTQSGAASS